MFRLKMLAEIVRAAVRRRVAILRHLALETAIAQYVCTLVKILFFKELARLSMRHAVSNKTMRNKGCCKRCVALRATVDLSSFIQHRFNYRESERPAL